MILLQSPECPVSHQFSCKKAASEEIYSASKDQISSTKDSNRFRGTSSTGRCLSCNSDHSKSLEIVFRNDKHIAEQTCPDDCWSDEFSEGLAAQPWDVLVPSEASATSEEVSPQQKEDEVIRWEHKSALKKKFQFGCSEAGEPILLNQIYTELYITEGGAGDVNKEHELRQIEVSSRSEGAETRIRQENIFKGSPGRPEPVRTVLTKGVAGIGKTVLTQKFTLDWAEGKTNQDIHFIFPFTFRELNVLKENKFSLVELVHHFFPETKEMRSFEDLQPVFIFDGLDECRLPLDFHNTEVLTDVTESTSVDALLTNLIRRKLLPSARLWITTRPAAANQIPPECVAMVTEVRGFTDPQKDEYFRKRFGDSEQASRIISHIKTSRSLHIMCHIPVFCWITATVLEDVMETRAGGELPKSLTEMYVHFLLVQTKVKKLKYDRGAGTDPTWSPESRKMMETLGKLAFDGLQKGKLIFYESDLREWGIDIRAASVCSGVFTQIFKEERGLYQDKVFCFVHLSVQEFLAALHVHQTFISSGVNLFRNDPAVKFLKFFNKALVKNLHMSAVDEALKSENGHLDLFLRFLLGFSLPTIQGLLGQVIGREMDPQTNQETICYITEKINKNQSAEKSINLFHCLNELNHRSLLEEVQKSLSSRRLSTENLSPGQWSALVYILLTSGQDLDVFDLKKFSATDESLHWLLPVLKASRRAVLDFCVLSATNLAALGSVLCSKSNLRELDLSNNHLRASELTRIVDALESPKNSLESLRLSGCVLTGGSISILSSRVGRLRELDLSNSSLQDSGVQTLAVGLRSPNCALQTLRLRVCNLSESSGEILAFAVSSHGNNLKELDLSNNDMEDSGAKKLSAGLKSPNCKLETLRLSGCLLTGESCPALASALTSSRLRELDLTYNNPGESGLELLAHKLADPLCSLQSLRTEPAGARWVTPGLRKYFCELSINPNTANRNVILSDNSSAASFVEEDQPYPEHPDRFEQNHQVLCSSPLDGRCYWEAELTRGVHTAVSYRGVPRRGEGNDGWFGGNGQSWSLYHNGTGYSVWHDKKGITVPHTASSAASTQRVAVYVDCPAGSLSFYRVSGETLLHLHTFNTTFAEPLYAGFGLWSWSGVPQGSSVHLRSLQKK